MQPETALTTSPNSWRSLVEKAIDNKVGADELNKLLDFVERLDSRQAERAYTDALNRVQAEVPTIVRDQTNDQTKSNYLSMDRLNMIAHPVYTAHGFTISFAEGQATREGWIRTVMEARHREGHCRTFFKELPPDGVGAKGNPIGMMNPIQGAVSSGTYAARVLLAGWLNVTIADSDKDGNTDLDTIDQAQCDQLRELIEEKKVDPVRFLAWAGVDELVKMPAYMFAKALDLLRRKKGGAE